MPLNEEFASALAAMREKRPLVHCITNYVTAGDVANMLLAAGASPIMADDPAEAAEIPADALVLNMGTPSESRFSAMLKAAAAANENGVPVVLDPVGVQLSEIRRAAARKFLSELKIAVIRGNLSEMLFLSGVHASSRGVDNAEEREESVRLYAAGELARRYGCVCALTGAEDIVTDGTRAVRLLNGCAALKRVSGAGDMTSALIAAFSAVCEPYKAAIFGTAFTGICGELSDYIPSCRYMGSFRENLFDNAGRDAEDLSARLRGEILNG
ncbi:MAG: hydroxyethylthiazole kinase [Lachnospiraceae bacterium]|nr:hydroxyethylthiazole kinase [Ruminococcus sp.]MCM1274838.1 hydroxyethylthiazole kinase [Lachnospiraceae bacterium]